VSSAAAAGGTEGPRPPRTKRRWARRDGARDSFDTLKTNQSNRRRRRRRRDVRAIRAAERRRRRGESPSQLTRIPEPTRGQFRPLRSSAPRAHGAGGTHPATVRRRRARRARRPLKIRSLRIAARSDQKGRSSCWRGGRSPQKDHRSSRGGRARFSCRASPKTPRAAAIRPGATAQSAMRRDGGGAKDPGAASPPPMGPFVLPKDRPPRAKSTKSSDGSASAGASARVHRRHIQPHGWRGGGRDRGTARGGFFC
jgi:hypothetical protein